MKTISRGERKSKMGVAAAHLTYADYDIAVAATELEACGEAGFVGEVDALMKTCISLRERISEATLLQREV